ncbi:hypothetical protein Tco_0948537 [Tanacetum coccineum]
MYVVFCTVYIERLATERGRRRGGTRREMGRSRAMFAVVSAKRSAALYNVFPISAPSSSHPNTPHSNKPNFQHSDIEAQTEIMKKMDPALIKITEEGSYKGYCKAEIVKYKVEKF